MILAVPRAYQAAVGCTELLTPLAVYNTNPQTKGDTLSQLKTTCISYCVGLNATRKLLAQ